MSYDILIVGVILYPLGIALDFWKETTYYQPWWQIRIKHKVS
jgi:hypothetical protein